MSNILKRGIWPKLVASLEKEEITILLGPRQVGKTTLINQLQLYLREKGVLPERIFSFSFDEISLRTELKRNSLFLQQKIERLLGKSLAEIDEEIYLFLDEAQKAPQVFDWLKIIYDQKIKVKIFLTGSSSLRIRDKTAETLSGRAAYLYLSPLTLSEIFEKDYDLYPQIENFNNLDLIRNRAKFFYQKEAEVNRLFEKLLFFGGLPKVFLADEKEARERLKAFSETYLEREIKDIGSRVNLENFHFTFRGLTKYTGSLFNLSKASSDLGLLRPALYHYLSLLEKTMIISFLLPRISMTLKAVSKSRKVYFFETGLVNHLLGFSNLEEIKNLSFLGKIFETFIFNQIKIKAQNSQIVPDLSYWRDFEGHEIDLVYERGKVIIPLEITINKIVENEKWRNFKAFFKNCPEAEFGLLIYRGEIAEKEISGKKVYCLPYFLF